ncbi:MAG: metal ABC transporter permease [Pyrobaculum sp.]
MSASLRTSATIINTAAGGFALSALIHAYVYTPLLFWPLVSLMSSAAVLGSHSPLALSKRMAFLAHAQAHAILTAALAAALVTAAVGLYHTPAFYIVVLAFLIFLNMSVALVERFGFKKDVATGVVMSLQLSTSIALIYVLRTNYPVEIDPVSLITGEYVLVTRGDFLTQLPMLAAALIFPIVYGGRYLYSGVDEHFAQSIGLRIRLLDYGFLTSMSLAVAASVYTLGSLIPAVLLVLPGAAAARLSHKLGDQIPLSISIAVASSAAAHYISWLFPQIWPVAALGLALFIALAAARR